MSTKAPPSQRGQNQQFGPAAASKADQLVTVLMLNVRDVATLLGIGVRTVWRLADRGDIPAPVGIGGRRLWHRPTLETFIADKAAAVAVNAQAGRHP